MSKESVLSEIREAAHGKALAAGGNDTDFDAAWEKSEPGLSLRYDQIAVGPPPPLAAPPAPVYLDIPVVYGQENTIYLFAAQDGFAAAFLGRSDAAYNALRSIGEATFGKSSDYAAPTKWRWTKDGLPGNRSGFVVINGRASRGLNIVHQPISEITADLEVFRGALASALSQFGVELLGSKAQPLLRLPTLRPASERPEDGAVVPDEDTAAPIVGTRTAPLSREDADARIAALERKYAAKLPSGLSEYQRGVMLALLCGSGNLFVEAVAGSGKSTTLQYAAELMADFAGPKAMVQFNKSIATINQNKLRAAGVAMDAVTLSSLGKSTLPPDYTKKVEGDKKMQSFFETEARLYLAKHFGFSENEVYNRASYDARLAVNRARKSSILSFNSAAYEMRNVLRKAFGIASSTCTPLDDEGALERTFDYYEVELALPSLGRPIPIGVVSSAFVRATQESKQEMIQRGVSGFSDFDYWPSIGAPFCTFTAHELLFVDEAQDLSASNIELIRQSLSPTGRVVFVGDRAQAIYAWRGADTNSVSNIIAKFGIPSEGLLPLSTCYRCDRAIIRAAQEYVPAIEATPWAGEGVVESQAKWQFDRLIEQRKGPQIGDMVVCRLNKPLGEFAMKIMRQPGLRVLVMGREDFYDDIEKMFKPLASKMERDGIDFSRFGVVVDQQIEKVRKNYEELYDDDTAKVDKAMEKVEDGYGFLRSVWEGLSETTINARTMPEFAEYLFGNGGLLQADSTLTLEELRKTRVVLSSIHRAKGDEADTVWWIGPDLEGGKKKKPRPGESPQPEKAWKVQEEKNLKYVATTRAKHRLVKIAYER